MRAAGSHTAAAVVAFLVLAGGVGGCSSDASPKPAPMPEESDSSSAAPSPSRPSDESPPTLPAEAKGTSPAAAKAFARHYVDAINFAMTSGQTEPLRQMASKACRTCLGVASDIDAVYRNGGRLEGDGWLIEEFQYIPTSSKVVLVGMAVEISPQRAYSSPGAEPSTSAATSGYLELRLRHRGRAWRVVQMDATQ